MKILLIMPHPNKRRNLVSKFNYPSLTLQQVAAVTPTEHDVVIVDERYESINFNEKYDLIGISCLTYNSIRGYEIAALFRKQSIPVVFGGYHASLMPDEVKQHADSVVIGEAELTWPRLLKDAEKGELKPFYKAERLTKAEEIPPARHDIGVYTLFAEAIQASRGCPTGCEFCAMNMVEGRTFRGRPVDAILEEINTIKAKKIFFADASLTINPIYSKQLFKSLKETNKQFDCFGNINVIARDDEFLQLAHEAGVYKWYLGIESISQANIDQAGKGTNKVENYAKAIQKIKDHGMVVTGFFIFGLDHDTLDIFDRTLQAIFDWGLDEASFSIITPYPGTRLFERLESEGRIISRDWSRYQEGKINIKPKLMTEKELWDGTRRIALEFFSIKNCIKRSFVSNDLNPVNITIRLLSNLAGRSFNRNEKFNK